jgi:hypothetical protein
VTFSKLTWTERFRATRSPCRVVAIGGAKASAADRAAAGVEKAADRAGEAGDARERIPAAAAVGVVEKEGVGIYNVNKEYV